MRIVSLAPSFTETLERLGTHHELAGITDHCPEIGGHAARIGSPKALKISAIENLRPEIILADQNENRPEEIRELQKTFRVSLFDVRSVPAVVDAVWAMARLTGKTAEGEKLSGEIQSAFQTNQKLFKDITPVPALILLWNQPYLTVNFDTYISRLMEASGAVNVFHQDPLREFPVELEDMIEKNPEVLLLAKDPFPFRKRHIEKFRQYRVFSKIRIELVDGLLLSRFGPRTVWALETLRSLFLERNMHVQ